jgi:hypothetical protein
MPKASLVLKRFVAGGNMMKHHEIEFNLRRFQRRSGV